MNKREMGTWGEEQAMAFLERHGYEIVERNYQARHGEIDIIGWHDKYHHGRTLCFIEVKTRTYGVGSAERATGGGKLRHLLTAARQYCQFHHIPMDSTPIQFEHISVYANRRTKAVKIKKYVIPVD